MDFGRNQILIGVAVLAVALLIVVPIVVSSDKSNRLAEAHENVNGIRQAELDHRDAFGAFVSAESAPRAAHAVDGNAAAWVATEGFRKLSWAPQASAVHCAYQVQADAQGFKVIGACDIDGDGQRALVEATHESEAKAVTADGVY